LQRAEKFQAGIGEGKRCLGASVRGWAKTDMSPRKDRISRYREGICNEIVGQNWAVRRTRNAERNSQKTYIASAGSASAKRSWGPCWKFGIATGCLKLQETEFYLCFTGTKK
jgi:hypothetical protein